MLIPLSDIEVKPHSHENSQPAFSFGRAGQFSLPMMVMLIVVRMMSFCVEASGRRPSLGFGPLPAGRRAAAAPKPRRGRRSRERERRHSTECRRAASPTRERSCKLSKRERTEGSDLEPKWRRCGDDGEIYSGLSCPSGRSAANRPTKPLACEENAWLCQKAQSI